MNKENTNTGIWIDSRTAIIVKLKNGEEVVEKIESGIESKERFEGEGKQFGRMGNQFLTFEKKDEERKKKDVKVFLQSVIESIKEDDSIIIFGPAEMKNELKKEISGNPDLSAKIKAVETTDSMTENQVVAWVKEAFGWKRL